MNTNDAQVRLSRILQRGEQPLIFEEATALPFDDPELRLFSGNSRASVWVAVTPCRIIEIGGNDNVHSARWSDMDWLRVQKQGRKWRYEWQRVGQYMAYAPIQVSRDLAEILDGVQQGSISLSVLPDEDTDYTVMDSPHESSSMGVVAAAMGVPEKRCICDSCGSTVGIDEPFGDDCPSCLRILRKR